VFVIVLRHLSLCFVAYECRDILVATHTLGVYHALRKKEKKGGGDDGKSGIPILVPFLFCCYVDDDNLACVIQERRMDVVVLLYDG